MLFYIARHDLFDNTCSQHMYRFQLQLEPIKEIHTWRF